MKGGRNEEEFERILKRREAWEEQIGRERPPSEISRHTMQRSLYFPRLSPLYLLRGFGNFYFYSPFYHSTNSRVLRVVGRGAVAWELPPITIGHVSQSTGFNSLRVSWIVGPDFGTLSRYNN